MRSRSRSLWLWFLAMFVCLGLAYGASLPKAEKSEGKVALVKFDVANISAVELSDAQVEVQAWRRKENPDQWWISFEDKSQKGGAVAESSRDAAVDSASEKFIASDHFLDYLKQIAEFSALRDLGSVGSERLAEFGLDKPSKNLVVRDLANNVLLKLQIGKQLYASRSFYAEKDQDKKVLVVSSEVMTDLEKPQGRFYQRMITRRNLEEVLSVSINSGGKSNKFVRDKSAGGALSEWFINMAGVEKAPGFTTWFEKFGGLKAALYASDQLQDRLSKMHPILVLEVDDAGSKEVVEVRQMTSDGKEEYWLTSGFLGWHVKVATARAETLIKDLPQILGQ